MANPTSDVVSQLVTLDQLQRAVAEAPVSAGRLEPQLPQTGTKRACHRADEVLGGLVESAPVADLRAAPAAGPVADLRAGAAGPES